MQDAGSFHKVFGGRRWVPRLSHDNFPSRLWSLLPPTIKYSSSAGRTWLQKKSMILFLFLYEVYYFICTLGYHAQQPNRCRLANPSQTPCHASLESGRERKGVWEGLQPNSASSTSR